MDFPYAMEDGEIGRGAFGRVRKATDKKMGKVVAIKFIRRTDFLVSRAEVDILTNLQRLENPNAVKMLTHFDHKVAMAYCIVMEFCNGGNLEAYIRQPEARTDETVRALMIQLLNGLRILHENNIIHRDLKPANIVLHCGDSRHLPITPKTNPKHIGLKITDFGLSKIYDHAQTSHTNCGTPVYRAPEVPLGKYDYKCDIWSLGLIVYETKWGLLRFPGLMDSTHDQQCNTYTQKLQTFAQQHHEKTSTPLSELVRDLLRTNPDQRKKLKDTMNSSFFTAARPVSQASGQPLIGTGDHLHTVVHGDTLFLIGRKYGVDYNKIARDNNIANPNYIMAGMTLAIRK